MSCLVNPVGWRLYYRRHWDVNIYVRERFYPILNFKLQAIRAFLNNFLKVSSIRFRGRNLITFLDVRLLANGKDVFIIIYFRLNWNKLAKDLKVVHTRFMKNTKEFYDPPVHGLITKKPRPSSFRAAVMHYSFSTDDKVERKIFFISKNHRKMLPNYTFPYQDKADYQLFKILLNFFAFAPLFEFYKIYITTILNNFIYKNKIVSHIYFVPITPIYMIRADFLSKYVRYVILKRRYSPGRALYAALKIIRKWQKIQPIKGYKVLLAGRFSRRDRATYMWRNMGAVKLGDRLSSIDFFSLPILSTYSKAVIKIWICRN